MRGHVRKRGPRKWQLVYDVPRGSDGKRQQRYETVNGTKKQAETRLTEILRSLDRGRYFEPTQMSVSQYLDLWLKDYAEPSVRPSTFEGYRVIVEAGLKPALGDTGLVHLTARDVSSYYAQMTREGKSAQTVLHHHRVLRQSLKQAVRWDLIARNVTDSVKPPRRSRPKIRVLTPDEARSLLASSEYTDYHVPIHLALHAGLRRSETLGLRWGDVDFAESAIRVVRTMVGVRSSNGVAYGEPKSTRSKRVISIGEGLLEALEARRELLRLATDGDLTGPSGQVCLRLDGVQMTPNMFSHGFRRVARSSGFAGVRYHDLRHTHATMLLEGGIPVHVVQARLGHETVQTTVDVYGHVLPASDNDARDLIEGLFRN